ncbi:cytochrome P450 [Mycena galericulata]|nr:cytochrome P450 [Mycena galericulata]
MLAALHAPLSPSNPATSSARPMATLAVYALLLVCALYALVQFLRPFVALYGHLRRARAIGLPIKLIPFPPGLFSFFAFQILRKLRLLRPGTKLHKLLTLGRPDSYALHAEMGDLFVTVSPAGLTLIVADPAVAAHVNAKRAEFPKPPNTGAIINIYGRNVINADGDVWRLHRRVTGPVFSERIHAAVWLEAVRLTRLMVASWGAPAPVVRIANIGEDTLRLGLHVITGTAYGTPLGWADSPPCAVQTPLSYRAAMAQLTAHLMPIYLTPRWLLRAAPAGTAWGHAWAAYAAFGGYMRGMLERTKVRLDKGEAAPEDDLLTVLVSAERDGGGGGGGGKDTEKGGRRMRAEEVLGNAFIMLFAGHETSANTLHYALILLALHPPVQARVLAEVDALHARAGAEGRGELEYERDFAGVRWIFAVMNETLRVYPPTGMTNKWTAADAPIAFGGRTYVVPAGTRVSVNGTGVHLNPRVWGAEAGVWRPERWIVGPPSSSFSPSPSRSRSPSPKSKSREGEGEGEGDAESEVESKPPPGLLKPPKGTFLPFSEGARACSGRKFASVEFAAVLCTLLRYHRIALDADAGGGQGGGEGRGEGRGWDEARVRGVLAGRKAGAVTLQPPEVVPLLFVRR